VTGHRTPSGSPDCHTVEPLPAAVGLRVADDQQQAKQAACHAACRGCDLEPDQARRGDLQPGLGVLPDHIQRTQLVLGELAAVGGACDQGLAGPALNAASISPASVSQACACSA
jgi:hypothetical protein